MKNTREQSKEETKILSASDRKIIANSEFDDNGDEDEVAENDEEEEKEKKMMEMRKGRKNNEKTVKQRDSIMQQGWATSIRLFHFILFKLRIRYAYTIQINARIRPEGTTEIIFFLSRYDILRSFLVLEKWWHR